MSSCEYRVPEEASAFSEQASVRDAVKKFTVLIAARDGSHRSTIASHLKKRGLDVMVTHCARTAIATARSGDIDLVVTGAAMPGLNGYELTRELRECLPELPVILLSAGGSLLDDMLLDSALAVGERAVRKFDSSIYAGLNAPHGAMLPQHAMLTPREQQVMDLLTHGHGNKSVARLLSISPRTVENHRAHLMRKMKARSLAELVRFALRQAREV